MSERRKIYCAGCQGEVSARLTNGKETYPHRQDLFGLPFWKCDACGNFVGCHYKTKNRTKPLGIIATKELKSARQHIHRILDPIWKQKHVRRGDLYRRIASALEIQEYHTAELKTVDDARAAYQVVLNIRKELSIK